MARVDTHIFSHALGGIKRRNIIFGGCRALLDAEEDAGKQVHAHGCEEQEPANLEQRRPEVDYGIVLHFPAPRFGIG